MIPNDLSEIFLDNFYEKLVTVNTKIPVMTEEGNEALLSYTGVLVDIDKYFFYLGNEPDKPEIAISLSDVSNISIYRHEIPEPEIDTLM